MLMRIAFGCAFLALTLACGSSNRLPPDHHIAAHIADNRITEADLDAAWQERKPAEFALAQQNVYRMRREVLDDLIADALVAEEVVRLNRSETELVAQAVESGVVDAGLPVDDADVAALYEQSGAAEYGIRMDTLRQEFIAVLEEQRAMETRDRYRDHLRANRDVRILLDAPRTFIPVMPEDPIRGAPDAPIQIIEFSDFHCPFCRRARPVLQQLVEKYTGQVQWIWKDYPLGSRVAAQAAACAYDQGRFWAYHDALFERQEDISPDHDHALLRLARALGLDDELLAACLAEERHQDGIASDVATGAAVGVAGTPTVFVNGRMIAGAQSFETYEQVVLDELQLIRDRNHGRMR